jgi:hypothetical protein
MAVLSFFAMAMYIKCFVDSVCCTVLDFVSSRVAVESPIGREVWIKVTDPSVSFRESEPRTDCCAIGDSLGRLNRISIIVMEKALRSDAHIGSHSKTQPVGCIANYLTT